ncbi:unannotated protein [freshwater metagenome]|uniref:Unannotated protein n=1 Tax=freshwater metagenome TaxID=449393 RepID=A0A6J7QTL3_9ZZZZ
MKKTIAAKMARVLNWRVRYAEAPSWIAPAISFIRSVPSLAERTSRTRTAATPRAASAMMATTTTVVRLPPDNSIMGLLPYRRVAQPGSWVRSTCGVYATRAAVRGRLGYRPSWADSRESKTSMSVSTPVISNTFPTRSPGAARHR